MQRDTPDLLQDILNAMGFITEDTAGITFESFILDRRKRQLVERNFEIIGEAMNRMSRHDPNVVARIRIYLRFASR